MNILLIDNGTRVLGELKKLLQAHAVSIIDRGEAYPNSRLFDLIILSGGSRIPIIGNEKEYSQEIELIKTSEKPLLGICLGFELIGHAYGATLKRMEKKEEGIIKMKVVKEDPVFKGMNELKVYENHRWVVEHVGSELEALAKSKDGIEIIKHKSHLVYGFQFHPELFPNQSEGDELFKNFLKLVA